MFYRIIAIYLLSIASKLGFSQEVPLFKKKIIVSDLCVEIYYSLGDSIRYVQQFDKNTSILLKEETFVGYKRNGTTKSYYPSGELESIKNYLLDVPIGLYITFYENGNIKTLYDYGYSVTDINLKPKEYEHEEYDSVTGEEIGSSTLVFKPKNGKEYVYSEDGSLAEIIKYFDNKCLRVLSYDKNGNVTEKECPKE